MTLDVVTALFTNGQADRAVALCREHVQQNPSDPQGWDLLGIMYYNLRQHRPALEAVARARDLAPEDPRILGHLGAVLKAMGRLPEAEKAILASLDRAPDNPEVLNNYGNLLSDMHRAFEAEEAFRRVIALDPGNASAYGNMAYTMFLLGRNNEGEAFARRGLKVDPDSALLQNSMGSAIMGQDRMVEAAGYFRRAVELDPGFTVAHSNLLFCRNYDPEASAEEIFADYRAWDELHARPLVPAQPVYDNDRDPERKIRLGLVSPDFRRHAANFFLEPLLEAHDRSQVELYLYGMVAAPDRHTELYKELATAWRNVTGLSDEEMAAQIREDRIDILVDLAGHTAKHRLTAFALRPAPVMVAYLVGLGYTTGMSVFDGFFADDAMAPPDAAHLFSEPVLRLTRFPMTYRPPAEMPAVGPLPAARGQGITFGSFCRTVRINARVIRAWARILQAVPGSRLMLNTKSFAEAETRQTYRDLFAREGIAAERLQLVYTQPQSVTWEAYNGVDIALDPFPHNAGTTTFEALWMGVPVITRMDRPSVGRFGASILHSLGYPEWVAPDDDGYVRRAVALAGDVQALAAIREGLRERMRSSPLLDAKGLAREMEGHYRRLWRGWCLGRLEPQSSAPARADLLYRQGGQEQAAETAAAASAPPALAPRPAGETAEAAARAIQADLAAGRTAQAAQAAAELSAAHPDQARFLLLLADAFVALGREGEAEGVLVQARALDPSAQAHLRLGRLYRRQGRLAPARAACRAAIAAAPALPEAQVELAQIAHQDGDPALAERHYRKVFALAPADLAVANNLAAICLDSGRPAAAEEFARAAAEQAPTQPQVRGNLAMALCEQGAVAEGTALLQELVDRGAATARIHANLLFAQNYDPARDAGALRRNVEGWAARHAAPVPCAGLGPAESADGRRLRVGYVSPDFRIHAMLNFVLPLLQAHDRRKLELFLYAELGSPDAGNDLYRQAAEHWRDTAGRDDADLAEQIRRDRIDVLVDLAGHTAQARLSLFAHRAAPVQLAYPIGFGTTTGLKQFDGLVADPVLAPPGCEGEFTEPVHRLDGPWLAWRPQAPFPNVAPPPADRNGHVTFGSFSRVIRLNDQVVRAWAGILGAVPESRLLLNNRAFQEQAVRRRFRDLFGRQGIAADRLDLVHVTPQAASLSHYGQVDITLDPFPHSAATTVAESLWMGVPVVTLRGATPVGRLGASILSAAGLQAWIADDLAGYADIAIRLAGDRDRLRAARAGLRAHLEGGALADHAGLARRLEALYQDRLRSATGAAAPAQAGPPASGGGDPLAPVLDKALAELGAGRARQALDLLAPLLAGAPDHERLLYYYVVACINTAAGAGQAEPGLEPAGRLVALHPGNAEYNNVHGILLRRAGQAEAAEAAFRAAIAHGPAHSDAWFNLAALLRGQDRHAEGEALMAELCRRAPDSGRAWVGLGAARQMQQNVRGAIEAYEHGLALAPDEYEGWSNLCPMRIIIDDFAGAVEAGKKAIALKPGQTKDLTNIGVAEYRLFNLKAAEGYCRQSLAVDPGYALAWNNLANIFLDEARFDEAFAAYRQAVSAGRDGAQHHSNLLFALNYAPDMTAEAIFEEYRAWDRRHAAPVVPAAARHANSRDPARRLRVGYMSPDFRHHAARNFLLPLFEGHDRAQVELVLYSEAAAPDAMTARFRELADTWRETFGLSDDAVAAMAARDGIDILVDLASHTAGNRLLAMARRPAPLQVSLLVGLGYTTGIAGFDYFVGDADMTPPEAAHLFGETLIRLGRFPMAYRAPAEMPAATPLPALRNGHVTFGSLSRTMRLNHHVIAAWARILHAVPGSRLVLNNKPYADPAVRDLFVDRFVRHGIDPSRLEVFRGSVDYRGIDIALDPWPHNAGTTTCEALWMGVPVLSKRDRPSVGRFGASILRSVGLADWVADDVEGYLARAVQAAADLQGLAALRAGLRARMQSSPLCDGRDLAAHLETAFRAAWERWCRGEGPAPITLDAQGRVTSIG